MDYMAAQMDRQIEGAERRYNAALEDGENPAFPVAASEYGGHGTCLGLTIRDYFAAKAMNGICSHSETWGLVEQEIAEHAYRLADAMLAARVKP
ncbi:hypothetical protein [Pseudomonas soli]|uniref:Uncharacterized protein n=1 Tax=Pseudomonas soli TaxID=1306993 RepID=A0AAJ5MHW3_9PSED|nr:hypothetical protein [Pseudomonas soli]UXZ43572.1 hypothetical protein K7K07_15965 [Pseudomonas soli]